MSNHPTIYVVDAAVAMTGALMAARNMARALHGLATMVLVLPIGSALTHAEAPEFARVEYVPLVNPSKQRSLLLHYLPALLKSSWQLRRMMSSDGATQIVLNDFYLLHGVVLRLFGFRGKIFQWVRCDPERFAGRAALLFLTFANYSANQLVTVSGFVQSKLSAFPKTQLLYDAFTGTAVSRTLSGQEKIFLFIGNYIAGKGQDMAIEAFADAVKQDSTLRLHFYGSTMDLEKNIAYRAQLEARANALGIADKVLFAGFVKDTTPLLQAAYASLNFSDSESFSMTTLEASGAGLPVIATRSGGPAEIIVDGETGYLIPVRDVAAATARMLDLAHDHNRAQAMGAAGAARVQKLFSQENYQAAIKQLLLG